MKKIISAAAALLVMTVLITGCGEDGAQNPPGTDSPAQLFSAEESQLSAEGGSDRPDSAEDPAPDDEGENVDAESAQGITVKVSDYGYAMRYDADRYEYRRVEGYDDYSLKKYEGDKPSVYLCVSAVGAEYFDDIRASLMGEDASSVTLGKDEVSGEMNELKDTWSEGDIYSRTYLCRVNDGGGLLIEMQYYTENGKNVYEADLNEMLSSIELR
ncbi:MAG: hypothetical protein ACLVAI_04135 [Anaerovoracaceae bacterium]